MIKFNDLKKGNDRFKKEFQQTFETFLDSGWYILGSNVEKFEKEFASFCGTKYCVGVGNGLDALILIFKAYIALGKLKKGDEILVPANTYIATILAITETGLTPVLVEPNIETYNISVKELKNKISTKTKGILVVHLYGRLAEMEEINKLAKTHKLLVIEDAAQAHGATSSNNKKAGNLSNAGAFSFYPTKNLGALGDGGAITTNDENLYFCAKKISNYGSIKKDVNEIKGINSRLDEIQAAFLSIKLKHLDADNKKRVAIAKKYVTCIKNTEITLPQFHDNHADNVFHVFPIRCNNRNKLQNFLTKNNIQTVIHYPTPPHKQNAYFEWNDFSFPITEQIHDTTLSLPIYPTIEKEEVIKIIEIINKF